MITDKEIIECLIKNKNQGFELLFDRYYRPLVLFTDKILNDINSAEDLIQDLFLKLHTKEFYKHINADALSSYLFQAAKNKAFNRLQKNDVLKNNADLDNLEIVEDEVIQLSEEIVNKINDELDKLPDRTSSVFKLIFLKKMKYKEAADELNISVNTIKTLLRNGMKHLREVFKDKEDLYMLIILRSLSLNKE